MKSGDASKNLLSRSIKEAIDCNQPESALDHLHTFVTKFLRTICAEYGIVTTKEKALHSITGEYVKALQSRGYIESEMTCRILKSSISTLEAFNEVRNNQSLAHDNSVLNYAEAILIFSHVTSAITFKI